MYETAKRYTEEKYYSKKELAQEIDHYLLEPIWQEIKTYRSFFRIDINIQNKMFILIENPLVLHRMMETHELIFAYVMKHTNKKEDADSSLYLNADEIQIWSLLLTQMRNHPSLTFDNYSQKLIDVFKLDDMDRSLQQHLIDERYPFLMRYFFLMFFTSKKTAYLMQYPLFLKHNCMSCIDAFAFDELYDLLHDDETGIDITHPFLALLDAIRLKLFHKMISLDREENDNLITQQYQELIERYPILHKNQILFYVDHRQFNHYYTIQDYMACSNVCYETARYSLDQLVKENWYHKQKLGKKFVYYVM